MTSDLQFSFKAKHGTTMCTMVLKEVVNHYLQNGSSVASCFIDSSKAFDLVCHDKLFNLMYTRNISAIDIRAMMIFTPNCKHNASGWDTFRARGLAQW